MQQSQSACNANKKMGKMNYKLKAFFVPYNFTSDASKSISGSVTKFPCNEDTMWRTYCDKITVWWSYWQPDVYHIYYYRPT